MKSVAALLLTAPCVPAPPGKSTVASSNPMSSLSFNLKYLPVTVAEDNGVGNEMNHGSLQIQGRSQALQDGHYTERNCELFSSTGSLSSASTYESMTSNGLGQACSYSSGQQYTGAKSVHSVFAFNKAQCCNACVATDGCVAASFKTSSNDHSGGMGPQSWEGFGIHLPSLPETKTTGGITVAELEDHFKTRLGDHSAFDQFMDYSVTFFTYDLKPYVDSFTQDSVPFFMGQWEAAQTKDTWYSMIFLVRDSSYVIELVSALPPSTESANLPQMEQRMSDAHVGKFKSYKSHPAHLLWISSINRAASDMSAIDDVYTNLFKAGTTHHISDQGIERRCYTFQSSSANAGPTALDEDVCFTARTPDSKKDATLSVQGFEQMLWSVHASLGSSPSTLQDDQYTDSHYALPLPYAGLSALSSHFASNSPFPITKDTRLAYACKQDYIIDPTGWSIQPIGMASWPNCGSLDNVVV